MQTIKVSGYNEIPFKYTGIIEWPKGSKSWYVDGKYHRLDGPAWEWANGSKEWWVDGVIVTESSYPEAVRMYKIKMVLG